MSNNKTGTQKNDDLRSASTGDREPVVNTEEQNKPLNPGDKDYKETASSAEPLLNNSNNSPRETKADGGSEVETPGRLEGEDAESTEKKLPNM